MPLCFFAALLAIAIGRASIATSTPIHARLVAHVGDPVIAFGVGFLVLAALVTRRGTVPHATSLAAAPWWVRRG